jgi:hypothetical protein
MNTKLTLAAIAATAIASQAVGSLWTADADKSYQVQVPCVLAGGPATNQNEDPEINTYDCAGWLYGYVYGPTGGATGTMAPLNGAELSTTDPLDGTVTPGGALDNTESAFIVTLGAGAGTDAAPLGAGVGFDYAKPKAAVDRSATTGYCINYSLEGSAMKAELGWDEATNGYDTYTAPVPLAATPTALDLPWAKFLKIGWAKPTADAPNNNPAWNNTIEFAKTNSWALKIKLENKTATPKTANLKLYQIGLVGECGTVPGPINSITGVSANSVKATLAGRSLSFSGLSKKAVSVQVISLQGQVVASAVVSTANSTMNLSKIADGVYVVKANGKGVNLNKMIALK